MTQRSSVNLKSLFGTVFGKDEIHQSDKMTRKSITPELVRTLACQLDATTLVTPDSIEHATSIARWSDTAVKNAVCGNARKRLEPKLIKKMAGRCGISSHSTSRVAVGHVRVRTRLGKCSQRRRSFHRRHQRHDRRARCRVDQERKIIVPQGGALWSDVDTAAADHGLATVGGTVNHTGIGGLTRAVGLAG